MKTKFKVLSVEDDVRWQSAIKEIVTMLGYEVEFVSSSIDAISRLRRSSYHVALLDKRLEENNPENDEGLKIATYIASLGEATKVVIFTAYGNTNDAVRAFHDIKVSHFVEKDEPLSKIMDALKKAAEEADLEFRRPARMSQNILPADQTVIGEFLAHSMTGARVQPDPQRLEFFAKRLLNEFRPLLPDSQPAKSIAFKHAQALQVRYWSRMLGCPIAVWLGQFEEMKSIIENIDSDEALRFSLDINRKISDLFDTNSFPEFGGAIYELRDVEFEDFKWNPDSPQYT